MRFKSTNSNLLLKSILEKKSPLQLLDQSICKTVLMTTLMMEWVVQQTPSKSRHYLTPSPFQWGKGRSHPHLSINLYLINLMQQSMMITLRSLFQKQKLTQKKILLLNNCNRTKIILDRSVPLLCNKSKSSRVRDKIQQKREISPLFTELKKAVWDKLFKFLSLLSCSWKDWWKLWKLPSEAFLESRWETTDKSNWTVANQRSQKTLLMEITSSNSLQLTSLLRLKLFKWCFWTHLIWLMRIFWR